MRFNVPYLCEDVDRHGNVRVYFRRRGCPKVRLRAAVGSEEFWTVYNRLKVESDAGFLTAIEPSADPLRPVPGSWWALCAAYLGSDSYQQLEPSTQRTRRRVLEGTWDEPLTPESKTTFGEMPVGRFGSKAVRVLRDRKKSLPEAANGRLKAISAVFRWALEDEQPHVIGNPVRDVARITNPSKGIHTWTDDEVRQFEAHHAIGTKARLALGLILLTGVRRSDVVRLDDAFRHGNRLKFTAFKNRNSKPVDLDLPVLPELDAILSASPTGSATYLETEYGKPFSAPGFGNWFKARCNEAGLSHCTAHGLRKAGSTRAAEHGATPHQLMAMFGWTTIQQAEVYTKAAARKRLANDGMPLIVSHSR